MADNHESTLGTCSNDLGNDTRTHTNLYSGQVEGVFGLFGNSIDTGAITANINHLIVTINPVLRMNYFVIVTISPVLMMNYFLIVILSHDGC